MTNDKDYNELATRELPRRAYDIALENVVGLLFSVIVLITFVQIIVRYIPFIPWTLPWTEAVARYTLVIASVFGSAVAWRTRDNITIGFFAQKLSKRNQAFLDIFKDVLTAVFVIFCIIGTYRMGVRTMMSPLGTLPFGKVGHVYYIMLVGFIVILIYLIMWIIKDLKDVVIILKEKL